MHGQSETHIYAKLKGNEGMSMGDDDVCVWGGGGTLTSFPGFSMDPRLEKPFRK